MYSRLLKSRSDLRALRAENGCERLDELTRYLNEGAEAIVQDLIRATLLSPRESVFLARFLISARKATAIREKLEAEGEHIPPFLIASITRACNLRCAGCYDRARECVSVAPDLDAEAWQSIFRQAAALGISFILLAGGEPMMRPDVLKAAAGERDILFPVFTNATLIDGERLAFLDANRNLMPVISIEGEERETDARRGEGVYDRVLATMDVLKKRNIPFGASITVTRENFREVIAPGFVAALRARGARAVVYVEYVPADGNEALAPGEGERQALDQAIRDFRTRYPMLFLSFPGDEAALGGCLAAGRGFFHIASDGAAEPCPFSPHSDITLRDHTLREALASPLFTRLREGGLLAIPRAGGCALAGRDGEVGQMARADA